MLQLLFVVVALTLTVYCVLDVLRTPREEIRTLPRPVWLLVIVLLGFLGAAAWLFLGRPQGAPGAGGGGRGFGGFGSGGGSGGGRGGSGPSLPQWPGRGGGRPAPRAPDDDPDFLRELDKRTREQRGDDPA